MKNKSKTSSLPAEKIFIIADESSDLSYLFEQFGISPSQEEITSLRFQIFSQPPTLSICELYIFPRNRQIKPYCELYNSLLGEPSLVIYALDIQSSINETIQWLNLFQKQLQTKIVFFSNAKTYLERQQILAKVCTLFLKNITDEVYFPFLNASSISDCLFNLKTVGVSMNSYARHTPAVSRLKWFWKRIKTWTKRGDDQSII